ncbi:MAG: transferase spermidine synthase [Massilia sp.]
MAPLPFDDKSAPPPLVTTCGDVRTLAFRPGEVQSEMRVSQPDRLVLAYVRAMMMFVLFVPRPRHIVMVGLGGGSLVKFCHRHLTCARITVIEVRADVIALREQFRVPPDDARLRVIHADACAWIASAEARADPADVVIVDGFDAAGLPAALVGARFYADCRRLLADGGVLVANIFSYDTRYRAMMGRLELIFGGRLARLAGVAGNNRIVFAVRSSLAGGDPTRPGRALAVQRYLGRRNGLGANLLNRLLVHAVLWWMRVRRCG